MRRINSRFFIPTALIVAVFAVYLRTDCPTIYLGDSGELSAAAFALGQIHHRRADEYLAIYADDRDPRVREIARRGLNTDPSVTASATPESM